MSRMILLILFSVVSFSVSAYDSGIAVQTEQGVKMQVYVNGKLYNKSPGKFVRVRSSHGLYHLEVRVMNPYTKRWSIVHKDVTTQKGFEFQYKVVFVNKIPRLKEFRKYPVYSRYFLNPALYNQHPVS